MATVASLVLGIVVMKSGDNDAADRRATVIDPGPADKPTQPAPTTEAAQPIAFTVSDRLTEGVEEETVYVSIEGNRVATLHASRERPDAAEEVEATSAGNYSYVVDAEVLWVDSDGLPRRTAASGRGSVYIEDGAELAVVLHEESDGSISLSLDAV